MIWFPKPKCLEDKTCLAAGALIVIAVIFGPSLWVKFVMRRYSEKPEMPGTGGELAKHLIVDFL